MLYCIDRYSNNRDRKILASTFQLLHIESFVVNIINVVRCCCWCCCSFSVVYASIKYKTTEGRVFICKTEITLPTEIEPGLFISNKGNVIIGAKRIGKMCVIQENVTIGTNPLTKGKATIGGNVWIGANSIITGAITIGNGTTIREGTVLSKSVPAHSVVQGNPARVVKIGLDNSQLLTNPYQSSHFFFEAA